MGLDPRKLLQWGKEDLLILLALFAALLSFTSTPKPLLPPDPEAHLKALLQQAPDDACRAKIQELWTHSSATRSSLLDVQVPPLVREMCHVPIDRAGRAAELQGGLWDGVPGEEDALRRARHWVTHNTTLAEARPPLLAFFIMIGPRDSPEGVVSLLSRLYQPHHVMLVNVDAKAPGALHDAVRIESQRLGPNLVVLDPPGQASWGGFSIVLLELRGMAALLAMGQWWDFWINLSGQDISLQPDAVLRRRLSGQGAANWMQAWPSNSSLDAGAVECQGKLFKVVEVRPPPRGIRRFQGSQWIIASREFVRYVLECLEGGWGGAWRHSGKECLVAREYARYSSESFIPDEGFFQTLLLNSPLCHTWVPENLRYVNWGTGGGACRDCASGTNLVGGCGNSPDFITLPVLERIFKEDKSLFARKADPRFDPRVFWTVDCFAETHMPKDCISSRSKSFDLLSGSESQVVIESLHVVQQEALMDGDLRTKSFVGKVKHDSEMRPGGSDLEDVWLTVRRGAAEFWEGLRGGSERPEITVFFDSVVLVEQVRVYWEGQEKWAYTLSLREVESEEWREVLNSTSMESVSWEYPSLPFEKIILHPPQPLSSLRLSFPHSNLPLVLLEVQVWGRSR